MAVYNKAKSELASAGIDWVNDTIKVMLLANTYTIDIDNHQFVSDVVTHEVSGSGYTAGGQALANKTRTTDVATDTVVLDADDVSWLNASFTARYAVIYKDTGTQTTSPLISVIDFGTDKTANNIEFKITWNANGIINIT